MKAMKFKQAALLVSAALVLGGCASKLIGERIGAESVKLAQPGDVAACTSKGKVTVSVLSEVGFITRSAEAVENNLLQMARNAAIDNWGDTVVKGNSTEYGKRTFEIFKCQN